MRNTEHVIVTESSNGLVTCVAQMRSLITIQTRFNAVVGVAGDGGLEGANHPDKNEGEVAEVAGMGGSSGGGA